MKDLEYITTGMFTRFVANTPAGVVAYNEMANTMGGNAAVLNIHAKNVIGQLRAAGYSVGEAKKPTESIDDILAQLNA
jgi:ABC-type sugar transport system substrate-binding protein